MRGFLNRVGAVGGGARGGRDDVEVVRDEGFVGDEEEERELFEDGHLLDAWDGDGLFEMLKCDHNT